jgi:hypothetical protein
MSAVNSIHQSNAQALAAARTVNQAAEERQEARERSEELAQLRRDQAIEQVDDAEGRRPLDTVA